MSITYPSYRDPRHSPLTIVTEMDLSGRDARVNWSADWTGAVLLTRSGLTARQRLEAVRWAIDVLDPHLDDDGYTDDGAIDLWFAAQLAPTA